MFLLSDGCSLYAGLMDFINSSSSPAPGRKSLLTPLRAISIAIAGADPVVKLTTADEIHLRKSIFD